MPTEGALYRAAERMNRRRSPVRTLRRTSMDHALDRLDSGNVFICGGSDVSRELAASAVIRRWAAQAPLPVLVLTSSRVLGCVLPEEMDVANVDRYNYMAGMTAVEAGTLLSALLEDRRGGEFEYALSFLQAVEHRCGSISLPLMAETAAVGDQQLAALVPEQARHALRNREASVRVRELIRVLAGKLPGCGEGCNLLSLAAEAYVDGMPCAAIRKLSGEQRLIRQVLAAEMRSLLDTALPFGVVMLDVTFAADDPLLEVLPMLAARAQVCVTSPVPVEGAQLLDTQVLFPWGDISHAMLDQCLNGLGKYMHVQVNASANREPFSMPWDRHDGMAIAQQERAVVTHEEASRATAVISCAREILVIHELN